MCKIFLIDIFNEIFISFTLILSQILMRDRIQLGPLIVSVVHNFDSKSVINSNMN